MSQEERSGARAKVEGLRVKYKSATIDAFLDDAFDDLGAGGMFIRTEQPFPVTTLLKFEVQISSTEVAVAGVGRVAWIRTKAQADEQLPAGMGIKFIKVDDKSRQVIDAVVERGSAGSDYIKGVRDSIRVAQNEQEAPASVSPPANPTIISVPPPVSRDAYRERSNTLVGIGSPSVPAPSSPPGIERAPVVVPTPSYLAEDASTKRLLPDSSPPSSFGHELTTEVWRRPEGLSPSVRPGSTPPGAGPARILTPSSLRPARLATPTPPPASIPSLSNLPDGLRRTQPPFRAPSAPPPPAAKSGLLMAVTWGVALLGLGALGFWFGTRGSVEHVEPKAEIIRPAAEVPPRVESAPTLPERVISIQTPDTGIALLAPPGASPLLPAAAPGRTQPPALQTPPVAQPPSSSAVDAAPVQTAPKTAEPSPPAETAALQVAPKSTEATPSEALPVQSAPKAAAPLVAPAVEPSKPVAPAPTIKSVDAG